VLMPEPEDCGEVEKNSCVFDCFWSCVCLLFLVLGCASACNVGA
jgi:hypothetical protein